MPCNACATPFFYSGAAALIMLSLWLIFRPAPPDHDAALPGEHSRRA
jgi:hypothetical protein